MFLARWDRGKSRQRVEFCLCKWRQWMGKVSPTGPKNYFNDVISHAIKLSQIKGQAQLPQEAVGAKGKEGASDQPCIQWV